MLLPSRYSMEVRSHSNACRHIHSNIVHIIKMPIKILVCHLYIGDHGKCLEYIIRLLLQFDGKSGQVGEGDVGTYKRDNEIEVGDSLKES